MFPITSSTISQLVPNGKQEVYLYFALRTEAPGGHRANCSYRLLSPTMIFNFKVTVATITLNEKSPFPLNSSSVVNLRFNEAPDSGLSNPRTPV